MRFAFQFATVALGIMVLSACGSGAGTQAATEELNRFATAAEDEFGARGEGTFVKTDYRVYCRAGSGFDEGPFAAIDFASDLAGYEFCYNVSDDLKTVALSATNMSAGTTQCLMLDATSGQVEKGQITDTSPCVP